MASLNQISLIGNAGKDCELKYSPSGTAVGSFSLAVNDRKRTKDGQYEDHTEWFGVTLFGKTAESVSQYITKGKPIYVQGKLQSREWDDREGGKHFSLEVIANDVVLLGSRDEEGTPRTRPSQKTEDISDLPFE